MQNKTLQMKKALRTALLILLLSAAGIANIFSQNQISSFSMYDQKRYELAEKTIEKTLGLMTIPEVQSFMRMYSAAKSQITSKQEETKCLETFILGFANNNPKDYRAKQFAQSFAPIYNDYKKQLATIEKNKNSLMKQPSSWASSLGVEQWTIGAVEKEVKEKFKKWATKREFEKTENYQNRIYTNGQRVFDSICRVVCSNTWKSDTKIKLLEYDADNESYNVSISRKDKKMNTEVGIMGKLSVPLDEAEQTKQLINEGYAITYEEQGLVIYKGQLFPTSFRMKRFGGLDVIVKTNLTEGEKATVCYDNLKIGLPDIDENLGGYCYDHNDYLVKMRIEEDRIRQEKQRQMEEEQRRKDSIQQERIRQEEKILRTAEHQKRIDGLSLQILNDSKRFLKEKTSGFIAKELGISDNTMKYWSVKTSMAKGVIKEKEESGDKVVVYTLKNNSKLPPIKFTDTSIIRSAFQNYVGTIQVSDDEKAFLIDLQHKNKNRKYNALMLILRNEKGEMDMYYFLDD